MALYGDFLFYFWVDFQIVQFGVMCRVPGFGRSTGSVFLRMAILNHVFI